ncbi:MAG: type II toxin-antitoxin system RelE/ParE family toxin [Pseudomonadota bacterium]|nr:type II toxin-antitoxin system RelE/ParE family toxin [Pseudomonadota bacterium]
MAARKRLEWTDTAKAELAESLSWYAIRNRAAAQRIKTAINSAALGLIDPIVPVLGKPGIVAGTQEMVVGKPAPFTLVYRCKPDAPDVLEILHVMHHARDYP